MLEINLQEEYENLQTSYGLNKSKEMKQNKSIPLLWCNGPPCPSWKKHLSISLSNGGAMAQWER